MDELLLENINILKKLNYEYIIKINNQVFNNVSNKKDEIINVKYKGKFDVEIFFYEEINENYLLSLDKIIKKKNDVYENNFEGNIYNFLSNVYPNINFVENIINLKKILKDIFKLDEINFYINPEFNLIQRIPFMKMEFKSNKILCLNNKIYLPIFFENNNIGLFLMYRNNGFDLFDYAILKKTKDYINKNIENSILENKFNIILDKSLNVLSKILEKRNPGAEEHNENIEKTALIIGEKLSLEKKDLKNLKFGSKIFDIGKIGIPERILSKKDELTKEEMEIIKKHVVNGYELVSKIPTIPKEVKEIVLYHHEKWNGEGYPEGLKGDEIPLLAQIIGLLDVYYALLEDKPYRNKLPKQKVLELMDSYSGVFFNPILVSVLKEVIENE
ncbi:HD-GYP domain-containing protein [Marinitoga litoralis]|uniref:HD-GYP domain-containing protein n=1 Tax=Marinitoga litoralis TaxID=570855 RepID=UPI001961C1D8|nr:HD domain-containing phosphohydrolase [Marinitoga litoralis]MBM7559161.1 HD-GYP domain-containing protein (c-di-GMP phosphodiesterase class II) [Marinitoga litoralis]